jgi:hypothetical protein
MIACFENDRINVALHVVAKPVDHHPKTVLFEHRTRLIRHDLDVIAKIRSARIL